MPPLMSSVGAVAASDATTTVCNKFCSNPHPFSSSLLRAVQVLQQSSSFFFSS
ncbi:threonyl-tRNA synthetase [Sesbania bispinosa]|nr:threonyl-tRNA synthetase [Sesbania bispinosa]